MTGRRSDHLLFGDFRLIIFDPNRLVIAEVDVGPERNDSCELNGVEVQIIYLGNPD